MPDGVVTIRNGNLHIASGISGTGISVVQVNIKIQIGGETEPDKIRPEQDGTDFAYRPCLDGVQDDYPDQSDDTDKAV